jgi:hypothetical protein
MRTSEDPTRDPASEARDDHASEPRATPETDAGWHPPFSYDIDEDGAYEVAVLANPKHTQGAWVKIEDYRRLQRQRDEWQGAFLLATKRAGDAGELLVELKRQRDGLLEALVELLAASSRFPSYHVISNQEMRRKEIACRAAEAAIAAVKGGKP